MDRIKFTGPTLGSPEWAGDFMSRDHLMPVPAKVDATQFLAPDGVKVTLTSAVVAADTSIAVSALSGAVPSGTVLNFGSGKFVITSSAAAAGATSIPITAAAAAISNGLSATYLGVMARSIPSGTAIGRTLSERDAGTAYGPASSSDDEIFLTAFDITDALTLDDVELYRHGAVVKENFLPGWANVDSGVKTAIRAAYACVRGAE